MLRLAVAALWAQTVSLFVGLAGMLVALPRMATFASDPNAMQFAAFMMAQGGMLDIMLGALAMAAFGFAAVGVRPTLVFLVLSLVISASAELTGTATGWPFGGYAYTSLLGMKLLGRVPYPIPFSWFSMGFASYLLADGVGRRFAKSARGRTIVAVVLGAWLLTAWDLVLDPAMANASSSLVHFWVWTEHGAYFGMPIRNFVGWFGTGVLFIGAARALDARLAPRVAVPLAIPFVMYAVNIVWAMALAASIGLWQPLVAAAVLGLLPAMLAFPYASKSRVAALFARRVASRR